MFVEPNSNQKNFDWISTKVKSPKLLTVTTYQALHSAFTNPKDEEADDESLIQLELLPELTQEEGEWEESEESEDDIVTDSSLKQRNNRKSLKDNLDEVITALKAQGVGTIILDESHHLRKEWWRALTELKENLEGITIVALTATPPYDVDPLEWQKYEELCGPIDAEISIPELVKTKDLCPHQDYIHFSLPKKEEEEKIISFKKQSKTFLENLTTNLDFINGLSSHRWIQNTTKHQQAILENAEFFSSILIFLNALGIKLPPPACKVLGAKQAQIPKLTPPWLETLLTGLLFKHNENFTSLEQTIETIKKDLRKFGAIEGKRVVLEDTKGLQKLIGSSLGKLDSILEITKSEYKSLKEDLRLVILSDYIRKDSLREKDSKSKGITTKLGVIPIFEYLRQSNIEPAKLGVLTGSIIIVPKSCEPVLKALFAREGLESALNSRELCYDDNFLRINISSKGQQKIVHIITELFNKGEINVLVGTQALLGEGWDAPTLNSLILASNVGTYMLSNQMRGRAIRVNPKDPNKTANIWHLVTLELVTLSDLLGSLFGKEIEPIRGQSINIFSELKQNVGHDMQKIIRRFKAFEAPSAYPPHQIENGFGRMSLAAPLENLAKKTQVITKNQCQRYVENINSGTLAKAQNRKELTRIWENSLQGKNARMHPKLATNNGPKTFVFGATIKAMLLSTLYTGIFLSSNAMKGMGKNPKIAFIVGSIILIALTAPKALKALWLWIRNGTLENSVSSVAAALLETLYEWKLVTTPIKNIKILVKKDNLGIVFVRLEGAKRPEEQVFLEALEEILGPPKSHRYLILRQENLGFFKSKDYHPVPTILGKTKKPANDFCESWNKYVGNGKLIYTRTAEGRKNLLEGRMKSLASNFIKKSKQISMWE
jgi:superfamily II DNA or RNA helicase